MIFLGKKVSFLMNFLVLTHSNILADMYVAVGRRIRQEFALMNLNTKTNGGFAHGMLLLPLEQYS